MEPPRTRILRDVRTRCVTAAPPHRPRRGPREVVCLGAAALAALASVACKRAPDESRAAPARANDGVSLSADRAARPAGPSALSGSAHIRTVFLILLENKVWSELKGNPDAPYLNGELLPKASIAEGYRAALEGRQHPSEPNYVWFEAGENLGIHDDENPAKNHRDTRAHLVTLLDAARISWRSYQEDIRGDDCPLVEVGMYAPKHNPMVFFDDVTDKNDPRSPRCIGHVRPLSELEADLREDRVARYNFITPNLCNDMHSSCEPERNVIRQGDRWLSRFMPKLLGSKAYEDAGVVFITWDEAEVAPGCLLADCPVGLLAFSRFAKGGGFSSHRTYDHSSLLRTVQEIFGVSPFLGHAASAEDLSELFTAFP